MTTVDLARPPAISARASLLWAIILAFLGAMVLLVFASSGILFALAGLCGMTLVAWLVWQFPFPAICLLAAMAPVNRFVLLLIWNVIGGGMIISVIQLWDDTILAVLVVRALHATFERRQTIKIQLLDFGVAFFVLLTAIYMFYPGTIAGSTLMVRFLGFKLDAYFMLAYFVGRGMDWTPQRIRIFLFSMVPSAIAVAVVAAWQAILPNQANAAFDRLHFGTFIQSLGGSDEFVIRTRDLAGTTLPRASSLLLGDLTLAFYMMFMIAMAAAMLYAARRPTAQVAAGAFLVAMLCTVILTVTRSAVMASGLSLVLITVLSRSYVRVLAVGTPMLCIGLGFFVVSGISGGSLKELVSAGEPSVRGHADAITISLQLIREEPFGRGLGTAGAISQRVSLEGGFTNESWYLQIATEIGIVGALLFAINLIAATIIAFSAYVRVKSTELSVLTLMATGIGLSYIMVGAVLHVWDLTPLSMIIWLILGICVGAVDLDKRWRRAETT